MMMIMIYISSTLTEYDNDDFDGDDYEMSLNSAALKSEYTSILENLILPSRLGNSKYENTLNKS